MAGSAGDDTVRTVGDQATLYGSTNLSPHTVVGSSRLPVVPVLVGTPVHTSTEGMADSARVATIFTVT